MMKTWTELMKKAYRMQQIVWRGWLFVFSARSDVQ